MCFSSNLQTQFLNKNDTTNFNIQKLFLCILNSVYNIFIYEHGVLEYEVDPWYHGISTNLLIELAAWVSNHGEKTKN